MNEARQYSRAELARELSKALNTKEEVHANNPYKIEGRRIENHEYLTLHANRKNEQMSMRDLNIMDMKYIDVDSLIKALLTIGSIDSKQAADKLSKAAIHNETYNKDSKLKQLNKEKIISTSKECLLELNRFSPTDIRKEFAVINVIHKINNLIEELLNL